jgi:glutamate racemase
VAEPARAGDQRRLAEPPATDGGARPAEHARTLPIAVFDSGVGGLTVLHECLVSLPHEDFVYLGDTSRFPYGDRTQEELRSFALELGERLVADGAKLLVIACNAATAAALPSLRERFEPAVPVIGVVTPESRLAAHATRNGRIGLLATPATVASGAYARAVERAAPGAALHEVACPRLASLIQGGGEIDDRVVGEVERACVPLRSAGVDTVILGCTHYPLVRPIIQRALGRGVAIVFSGEAIADEVERELMERGLQNDLDRRGGYRFICTGDPSEFRRLGTRFLQLPLGDVRTMAVEAPREVSAA